jgi:FAD linked oxidases, C-terminal domain.
MFIGSEGILGVISRAWMRLQPVQFRAGASVRFPPFSMPRALCVPSRKLASIRQIVASWTRRRPSTQVRRTAVLPSWCSRSSRAIIRWTPGCARAECCADHCGTPEPAKASDAHLQGAAGIWRNAFIRMPYAREFLTPAGLINDTFETAITWDRFENLHDKVKAATERAILDATGGKGEVTCRFTHVYPDGPAPYFSFHALVDTARFSSSGRPSRMRRATR